MTVTEANEVAERPDDLALLEDPEETPGLAQRVWRRTRDRARRLADAALRPREPLGTTSVAIVWALTVFGLLAVWALLYAFVLSGIQEHRTQSVLYAQLRQELAQATAPFGGSIEPGSALFVMDAPSGGVHGLVVVEGTTSSQLTAGAGHLPTTPMPGQAGVSVLLGRSVTFGAPFRNVAAMHPGDIITVTTGQGEFGYRVDDIRHVGDKLPTPLAAGQSRLVLITSVGSGWRAGWAPQQTVYVDASLQKGAVQPAPAGRTAAVAPGSQPMKGDSSGLVVLVLWLSALLLLVIGVMWARGRWGSWQVWLSAVPLVLACLWGATQAAVWLLPNLV